MAFSRYLLTKRIQSGRGMATSSNMSKIYEACEFSRIAFEPYVLEEGQRLDQLAGIAYQSSSYWWVIAAASGIGWGLQVPPGTILRIPKNIGAVLNLLT